MTINLEQGRTELIQRCMARLNEDITVEERIKILRIMASTAQTMINDLEFSEVTTNI